MQLSCEVLIMRFVSLVAGKEKNDFVQARLISGSAADRHGHVVTDNHSLFLSGTAELQTADPVFGGLLVVTDKNASTNTFTMVRIRNTNMFKRILSVRCRPSVFFNIVVCDHFVLLRGLKRGALGVERPRSAVEISHVGV
jgi:hypothetical protein